jgi:3D (Asp-Asp-Asp) domain-containing protein
MHRETALLLILGLLLPLTLFLSYVGNKIQHTESRLKSYETCYNALLQDWEARNREIESLKEELAEVEDYLKLKVSVSAYSLSVDQTDSDPLTPAIPSVKLVPGKHCAVSRDLHHLLGKKIFLKGLGVFEVVDTMNPRFTKKVDLLMATRGKAERFGVRHADLSVIVGGKS